MDERGTQKGALRSLFIQTRLSSPPGSEQLVAGGSGGDAGGGGGTIRQPLASTQQPGRHSGRAYTQQGAPSAAQSLKPGPASWPSAAGPRRSAQPARGSLLVGAAVPLPQPSTQLPQHPAAGLGGTQGGRPQLPAAPPWYHRGPPVPAQAQHPPGAQQHAVGSWPPQHQQLARQQQQGVQQRWQPQHPGQAQPPQSQHHGRQQPPPPQPQSVQTSQQRPAQHPPVQVKSGWQHPAGSWVAEASQQHQVPAGAVQAKPSQRSGFQHPWEAGGCAAVKQQGGGVPHAQQQQQQHPQQQQQEQQEQGRMHACQSPHSPLHQHSSPPPQALQHGASPKLGQHAPHAPPAETGPGPPVGRQSVDPHEQQQQQQQQPLQQGLQQQQQEAPEQQQQPQPQPPQQHPVERWESPVQAPAWQPKRPLRQHLSQWALPPGVVQAFEAKGVKSMYPWQAAALECGEQYNNLVYCAPTSGGKSLVAEVLMIRRLMLSLQHIPQPRRSKPKYGRALVVLPYASIVSEKTEHLITVLAPMRATVKGYYGAEEKGQALAPRGETVACCTIEKANVAINKLAQEDRLGELCCVVVDELHMVGDADRGVGLEMSLSKLLFSPAARHVQIIGMSATMGGLEALRAWLRAELFLTNFRPVPLSEHAVFRGKVYEKVGKEELAQMEEGHPPLREVREVEPSDGRRDADRLVPLVAEVTSEGHSVLVFCSTRKACESAAALIADLLPQISAAPEPARQAELAVQRAAILADVKIAMGGAMSVDLEKCMLQGVAWHHAGLTAEERAGVERAYRTGAVLVITATSTLAAGVNLPARRVILRSLHQGIGPVSRSQYLQMVGRAGRAGHSAVGESFIIGKGAANSQEWHQICALITAPIPCLRSSVLSLEAASTRDAAAGGAGEVTLRGTLHLQQLLLEGVANGSVREGADVQRLVCSTFAAQQQGLAMMQQASKAALKSLMAEKKLVKYIEDQTRQLELTHKGRAVYDSALPLEAAMQLYESCGHADDGFMLDQPLVLLYHCLLGHPFHIVSWPEWSRALHSLGRQERQIAESVGVLAIQAHAAQSGRPPNAEVQERHARLAAALALSELTQERDVQGVVAKWGREGFVSKGLTRGQIQKLQQDTGKWMGMASLLCDSAGWWPLATLYANLSQMAAAGVRQDLLPLMKIPDMDATKARALFKAGLRDAQALATADQQSVARALAPAIAQGMRSRVSAGKLSGGTAAASAANYAAAGMAARAAASLVRSARDHLRRQMRELAALTDDILEDEQAAAEARGAAQRAHNGDLLAAAGAQQQQAGQGGGNAAAAVGADVQDELLPDELAQIRHEVAQLGAAPAGGPGTPEKLAGAEVVVAPAAAQTWTQGVVKVIELRPRSTAAQLEDFFSLWGAQPRYALAVHALSDEELAAAASAAAAVPLPSRVGSTRRAGSAGGGGEAPQQRVQGLAVCWDLRQAFFLELSAAHSARPLRQDGSVTVLDAVRAVLAQRTHKVCYGALDTLPEFMHQAGAALGGQLEDPRLAGALLWPLGPEEDPSKLELKRLQGSVAPDFKARVPNLCRAGLTATCRTAVMTLACIDPLKQLLAHKGMLEAFVRLECPAVLAVLHINASPAAPRLQPAALGAARQLARDSAELATGQLRRLYGMPGMDLSDVDTLMQLLSALKLPIPERDRRRKPTVPLDHLQSLLRRCRPHQQREREVLSSLVQHKAVSQHLVAPLQALLDLAAATAAGGQEQGQGPRPGSAGGAAAMEDGAADPSGAAGVRLRGGTDVVLQLGLSATTGRLSYGGDLDRHLAALLSAEWCPFFAAGCDASVQDELARGSLTAEGLEAAAQHGSQGGVPVVLCVPARQLKAGPRAAAGLPAAGDGAAPGGDSGEQLPQAAAELSGEGLGEDEPEDKEVWVVGVLLRILGKRLRAALDFGPGQQQQQQQAAMRAAQDSSSQRVSLAAVRVVLLADEGCRLASAAGAASAAPAPATLELHWPCDQLWRLAGPSATVLGGASAGGIQCAASTASLRLTEAALAPPAMPAAPPAAVSWGLHGYCCGAAAFVTGGSSSGDDAYALRHKAALGRQQQQQQQPGLQTSDGVLLRIDLQAAELAALAQLGGQSELQAALCGSAGCAAAGGAAGTSTRSGGGSGGAGTGAEAYQRVAHCWAAAAGQLDVPGTGASGAGQSPVLVSAGTAEAVVHALVHGWTVRKLGWVLRCPKQAASEVLDSFLEAFPQLKAWLAQAAAAGEAACAATTLAGRQQAFPALKRADDAMGRGKLHKAILLHALHGSVADVAKAAFVACCGALRTLRSAQSSPAAHAAPGAGMPRNHAQHRNGQQQQDQREQDSPGVVLALSHTLVVALPGAWIAGRHAGSTSAAAGEVAACVQRALCNLTVGRARLGGPLPAAFSAGPSLHPLHMQPVSVPVPAADQAPQPVPQA